MPATHTVHQVHGPRGPVSTDTVRRRLRAAGLRNRRLRAAGLRNRRLRAAGLRNRRLRAAGLRNRNSLCGTNIHPSAPPTTSTVGATTSTMATCPVARSFVYR